MMRRPQRTGGFTLVEILVAVTIFAIMSILAYRGLSSSLQAKQRIAEENQRWRDLTVFFDRLENDFGALVPRPIKTASGLQAPAFQAQASTLSSTDAAVAFTRAGIAGQRGALAAPQRMGYRLRERTVELVVWPVLDQAPRTEAKGYRLLENVADLAMRYLDGTNQWRTTWPQTGAPATLIPNAIEVTVTMASGEKLTRLFAVHE